MTTATILLIIAGYFGILFLISQWTGRNASEETFFKGNRSSPWYLVAFGMIGASLSGVTFISVPGWVGTSQFSYMPMVFGYLAGYVVIAFILMPMYYRLNLTSIYGYLEKRFGFYSYKTGAAYFLLSRIIGASFRLFLVAMVLHEFVLKEIGIPFAATVAMSILLIWLYTFRGGIKTVVWTDTLQTLAMLLAASITVFVIKDKMDLGLWEMLEKVQESDYSKMMNFDPGHAKFFLKQFFSGAFIAIVMTGLDQDMMQKNLTCKNLKEAQLNMSSFSIVLLFVNLGFLVMGALLYMYGLENGFIQMEGAQLMLPGPDGVFAAASTDTLFPFLALNHLPPGIGILFILGLIAAAYSSADSALTALTTSFCVDFLDFEKKDPGADRTRTRTQVHIGFSLVLFVVILIFYAVNDQSVIASIFTAAGFTYGPLLGLYAFGLFTPWRVKDLWVLPVCIASPILSYLIHYATGGWLGFSILIVNGLITFVGMMLISAITEEYDGEVIQNNDLKKGSIKN